MAERSPEMLLDVFKTKGVVMFSDLQKALGKASRATTFRYLKRVRYLRSYNHNGRYYTYKDPALFDRFGLYSRGDIHFSRDGTLGARLKRLVRESQAGWTQRALQELLRVRVQVLLLEVVRHDEIRRERVAGFFLYLHRDPAIGQIQLQRRQERITARRPRAEEPVGVDDALVIQDIIAVVERTNNVAEHFFGTDKQKLRRRLGRANLGRDLEDQPAPAALASNLLHGDYVRGLCGSLEHLPASVAVHGPGCLCPVWC